MLIYWVRIFQVPKLGMKLKQDSIPLSYTPRKFITHPANSYFYLIEGDHRVMGQDAVDKKLAELVCLRSRHLITHTDTTIAPTGQETRRSRPQPLTRSLRPSKSPNRNLGIQHPHNRSRRRQNNFRLPIRRKRISILNRHSPILRKK